MGSKKYELCCGDCVDVLRGMESETVDCCVTSPPYFGLRDYGVEGQIGLESTPAEFVEKLVEVFREVRRVLRDDGTLWLNLGDSYNAGTNSKRKNGTGDAGNWHTADETGGIRVKVDGLKTKDLIGIPWRVAFALQADGWYLRQDIIWHKPNPMPESVKDRCTKAHEYIFLLSKSKRYYFDSEAIQEPAVCGSFPGNNSHRGETEYDQGDERHRTKKGLVAYAKKVRESAAKESFNGKTEAMAATGQNAFRAVTEKRNKRSVWTVTTKPYKGAHFATFPPALIEPCILAGSRVGGIVLDPFNGSGTTGEVSISNGRRYVGIELNPEYIKLADSRIGAAVDRMALFNS